MLHGRHPEEKKKSKGEANQFIPLHTGASSFISGWGVAARHRKILPLRWHRGPCHRKLNALIRDKPRGRLCAATRSLSFLIQSTRNWSWRYRRGLRLARTRVRGPFARLGRCTLFAGSAVAAGGLGVHVAAAAAARRRTLVLSLNVLDEGVAVREGHVAAAELAAKALPTALLCWRRERQQGGGLRRGRVERANGNS